jgi:hypothetical protein
LLFDLGRYDEALRLGARIPGCDTCGVNSDQALVMGDLLVRLGQGKQALAWLSPFSSVNLNFRVAR